MSESRIKSQILLDLGARPEFLLWNHPTGVGAALLPPHQVIHFGLKGSPDVIGVMSRLIEPDDVGALVGLAVGIEVKAEQGRQRPEQAQFQRAWERRGGIYILARSVEEAREKLGLT